MKKILALMLAATLALSLTACGGDSGAGDTNTPSGGNGDTTSTNTPSGGNGTQTKEEMMENADTVTIDRLASDFSNNIVSAKDEYIGKSFIVPGIVYEIREDSCILSVFYTVSYDEYFIKANIPADELKRLNTKDIVTIVGVITDLEEATDNWGGEQVNVNYINMTNAYFVDEISEVSGTVKEETIGYNNGGQEIIQTYIEMPMTTEDTQRIVLMNTFDFGIEEGDEVTISGSGILEHSSSGENFLITLGSVTINVDVKKAGQ